MFRTLDDGLLVSPQITTADVAEAARLGVKLIINNRPEGEEPGQPSGDEIAAAAAGHGIAYVAIPVTHAGFSMPQLDATIDAIAAAQGPILAYCRSGTRSTLLWALARAKQGDAPDDLAGKAAEAGYDLSPIRVMLDSLSAR
ncbi:TIGR01244 family sulfur transferase [Sphingomonas sanxanigenens]|uniref:Beta-lactamase hydrolase-like protein phosphatase-like domain-containing protein n=1 Tax=Sphingomonas sanxanigenens DSM 19645 = NX02 TaxID=1123269 RepID=W0AM06_9SPHN|nr:TIGR01244 family sulfur transferase [Sphingomonas sanxanigenens]AHE56735.1 hypothetical protein NX02_25650 [Sphingomonas sanxanigenens DSM 19645 = NX02]